MVKYGTDWNKKTNDRLRCFCRNYKGNNRGERRKGDADLDFVGRYVLVNRAIFLHMKHNK